MGQFDDNGVDSGIQEQVEVKVKSKGGGGRFNRESMKGVLHHERVENLTRLDKCFWFTCIGVGGRKVRCVGHAENVCEYGKQGPHDEQVHVNCDAEGQAYSADHACFLVKSEARTKLG